jgi:hypothetical protein
MSDEVYWFKDVLNPLHPYHPEYLEILQDPTVRGLGVRNFGGDSTHEARPYPGSVNSWTNTGLDVCAPCGEDASALGGKVDGYELKFMQQKQRIDMLSMLVDKQIHNLEQQLNDLRNSTSWKIGRMITAIPRKLNKNSY